LAARPDQGPPPALVQRPQRHGTERRGVEAGAQARDRAAVGRERDRLDLVPLAAERPLELEPPALGVPELDGPVPAPAGEGPAVGGEGHRRHDAAVAGLAAGPWLRLDSECHVFTILDSREVPGASGG